MIRSNRIALIAAVFSCALGLRSALASPTDFSKADWRKASDRDGIEVFSWEAPSSDVVAFKAVGVIDAPVTKVASVLVDIQRAKEWVPNLAEARMLRQVGPRERIDYTRIKTPIVLKDRDFVIDAKAEFDRPSRRLTLKMVSVDDPAVPGGDSVRGEILSSSYTVWPIDGGARTRIEFLAHVDPRGSVPKWIVNLFSTGFPRETLEALRKQSLRADIVERPEIREIYR